MVIGETRKTGYQLHRRNSAKCITYMKITSYDTKFIYN